MYLKYVCLLIILFLYSPVHAQSERPFKDYWNFDGKLLGSGWGPPPDEQPDNQDQLLEKYSIGDVAELAYWRFNVVQVMGKQSLLVSLRDAIFWVEGADTSKISDGDYVRLASPVLFIEKKEYKSTSGSKKIVKAIKVLSKSEYQDKRSEYFKKVAPLYTLNDGEKVQLIYKSTSSKGHLFETVNGEEKTYSVSDFDDESRKVLKSTIDAVRKAKSKKK